MLETVEKPRVKMKVCAVGEEAVGKTSLIRRFVADAFDGEYIRTIGTLISKKTVEVQRADGSPVVVDAVIWDIMGRQGFMDLLKEAYFYRAHGIFAVLDLTRHDTLEALHSWLQGVFHAVGQIPLVVLANKADLEKASEVGREAVAEFAEAYEAPFFLTSAKTGAGVEDGFEALIRLALERKRHPLPYRVAGEAPDGGTGTPNLYIGR